jgi:hypothetical protein
LIKSNIKDQAKNDDKTLKEYPNTQQFANGKRWEHNYAEKSYRDRSSKRLAVEIEEKSEASSETVGHRMLAISIFTFEDVRVSFESLL